MKEEQKEAIRESAKRPEVRLKHSIAGKKHYSDPENRAKASDRMKKVYEENPEYAKKRSEQLKKYYSNPENRLKCKERMNKYKDDPEYRKKLSEGVRRAWENKTPEEKEKIRAIRRETTRREDVREKNSISVRKLRMENREEILGKRQDLSRRSIRMRHRRCKFYAERDKYYNMTKKIDDVRSYHLITSEESLLRFFSATK